MDWLRSDLKALGFTSNDLRKLNPDHPEAYDFGGKDIIVRCTHSEWNDRPIEQWRIERVPRKATKEEFDQALLGLVDEAPEKADAEDIPF